MKFIVVAVLFVAGVSGQYGIPDEEPISRMDTYAPAPAPLPVRLMQSYAAPAPVRVLSSYEAPAPVRVLSSYEAPAPVRVLSSYEAPAPVRVLSSYEAPVRALPAYQAVEVRKPFVPIVELKVDNDNYGTYSVKSISGDGTSSIETANLKDLGDAEGPVSVSSGSYQFIGDDGKTYTTNWVADENGFRASGAHLPTSPPIPEEIRKSLVENSYAAPEQSSYAPLRLAPLAVVRSSY